MSDVILPDIPVTSIEDVEEQYRAVVDLRSKLEDILQSLLDNGTITNLGNSAAAISGTYVQAEVQQIADDTETVSNKVDSILAVLRTAGLLGE